MTGSEQMTIDPTAAAIRALNVTTGVLDHTGGEIGALISAIAAFSDFSEDNDRHGEHDFGSLTYMGLPLCWKIEYYDLDLANSSTDPADPDVTTRVLTIMMAWEY